MDLNHKLSDALGAAKIGQFKWTNIQLTNIHSYMEVDDRSANGNVINVAAGRGTTGSFSIKDFLGVADVSSCMSDAKDKVKLCPGYKPWILVRSRSIRTKTRLMDAI